MSATNDQVVIVTGGAGALGSTLVRTLVARGDTVIALDVPGATPRLDALVHELGERCIGVASDVRSIAHWTEVLTRIEADYGTPTAAALIAGAWDGGVPLHAATDDFTWDRMNTLNVDTVYRSLRALLPRMVARRRGSIVVVGSRAVERPWESAGAAAYAASKSAVVALARATAAEVVAHGVRVNAVLPSTIDTAANREAMPDADPSQWVSAESLSRVMAFLLSEDARDVTGAAIPVYGRI